MRKAIGTIFLILLLVVGIFGVDIKIRNNLITIKPYATNFINSDFVTKNYESLMKFLKENFIIIKKEKNE